MELAHWETLNKASGTQSELLAQLIDEAEAIVVGIGAGMSAATGFTYVGERFQKAFPDFIEKYNFYDMLQASLFEFEDLQEYWAFQSRFTLMNYFDQGEGQAYTDLKSILQDKEYHVITTNADSAFYMSDFDMDKVFRIQGEYGLMQCSKHCHDETYEDEMLMRQMAASIEDMKVPAHMIPYCPECGAPMEVNKRTEEKGMVEDFRFHQQKELYEKFLRLHSVGKVLYLEIGVGHTTPQFIKRPFQKMTANNEKALFITMNQKQYFIPREIRKQTIQIDDDIEEILHTIAMDQGEKHVSD